MASDYRYYSAEQLPQLNRILALKELGLSLDQIRRLLSDKVSTDEMQGMLLLKKAEAEQQLQAELQRIRNIESRLHFIRSAEANKPLDVIVKEISAQSILSVRTVVESAKAAIGIFRQIMAVLPEKSAYGLFMGIWHSDGIDESSLDVEMGRIIKMNTHPSIPLSADLHLTVHELPAVATMATFVVQGATENMHIGYSAIGTWAELNGYRFAGPSREIALQMPQAADGSDGVTEIQFPVESINQPERLTFASLSIPTRSRKGKNTVSNKHYVEVALYQLKSGVEEAQFLAVSDEAPNVYRKLEGFVRRALMKSEDGRWVDLVYWQNRDIAKQAEPTIYHDATIAKVMGVLDTETMIFTHAEPVRQDS